MKKTDLERLRKIVTTWDSLSAQMAQRNITRDVLMTDEFAQWAVTTPLYNIGEQVYQLTQGLKAKHPDSRGMPFPGCAIAWCMSTKASTGR